MPTEEIYRLEDLLKQLLPPQSREPLGPREGVYRPDPNNPRDPVPQMDRKKFETQRVESNPLVNLLAELQATTQPRPDLVPGGGRPATFAGRVTLGRETPAQVLARVPTESPDAEGLGLALPKLLASTGVAAAPSVRRLGTKIFKSGPNLDNPADAFAFLKSKIESGEISARQLQALSSTQGGRAGVLLPDKQMLFRATHGEAMSAVPAAMKGRVGPANQLMDVNTPFGRALLDVGSLDQLFQMK